MSPTEKFVDRIGGADRDRTDDLLNANQALFQLSYGPEILVQSTANERSGNEEQVLQKLFCVIYRWVNRSRNKSISKFRST